MALILLMTRAYPKRRQVLEISSHYPYYTAKLAPEPDAQTPVTPKNASDPEVINEGLVALEDRLELVRTQNLASPPQEPVDLAQAADLLRQVKDQMNALGKEEAKDLYQFDRLRNLLYQVANPNGL